MIFRQEILSEFIGDGCKYEMEWPLFYEMEWPLFYLLLYVAKFV